MANLANFADTTPLNEALALLDIWLGWRTTRQFAPANPIQPAGLVGPIHCSVTGWLGWLFMVHLSLPSRYHLQVVSTSDG